MPAIDDLRAQRRDARARGDHKALVAASRAVWQHLMTSNDYDGLLADLDVECAAAKATDNLAYEALCVSTQGLAHMRRREADKSEAAFRSAVRMYRTLGDASEIAGTRYHLGCLYSSVGRTSDARQQFQAALSTFRERKMGAWFAQASLRLADTYQAGEVQHIRYLKDALGAFAGIKQEREAAATASRLADSCARSGDDKTSEKLFFQAAQLYEKLEDHAGRAHILTRIALSYSHHRRDREAEFYYGEAVTSSVNAKLPHLAALCDAGTAASWDRLSIRSSAREQSLRHGVMLLLPAVLYMDAAVASTNPRDSIAQRWNSVYSDLLSWSICALESGDSDSDIRHELEKLAADRGCVINQPAVRARQRFRRQQIPTPDIAATLAEAHSIIAPIRSGAVPLSTGRSDLHHIENYAELARSRYETSESRGGAVS